MPRDFVTTLISVISLAFAALLPFGTNVPFARRPQLTRYFVLVNVAVHVMTQIIDIQSGLPLTRIMRRAEEGDIQGLLIQQYIDAFGLTPVKLLRGDEPWRWIQIITANFLHGSWMHLIMNLWFFVLFSVNLEDAFGPKKYLLTMGAAMLGSMLSIAFFTPEGSEAARIPHLGFSGVLYAVMAAYLVCFPRSRIRFMLIYNLWFWMIGLFGAGFLAIILYIFVGSLAELLWFLAFVGLFAAMQPGRLVIEIPAFVFLGFRVLYDGLTLDSQMWSSGVSVWGHAGGFMVGTTAALLVYGTKGLTQTWESKKEKPELSRQEQAKQQAASLMESARADETAARAVLGRFVFLRDSAAACELYANVVVPTWPELTLEYDLQLDLARMLNLRGQTDLAIHAYDRLLWHYPNGQGADEAYLAVVKLTQKVPDRLSIALQYLNKLDTMECLMRDRLESRRLRGEIEAFAAEKGIDLGEAATLVFEGMTGAAPPSAAGQAGAWESRLPLSKPPSSSRASSRIQQLEPAAEKAQSSGQFMSGRKPLPLKSLDRARTETEGIEPTAAADRAPDKGRKPLGLQIDVPANYGGADDRESRLPHTEDSGHDPTPRPAVSPSSVSRPAAMGPAETDRIEVRGPISVDPDSPDNPASSSDDLQDLYRTPVVAQNRSADTEALSSEQALGGTSAPPGPDMSGLGTATYCVILNEGVAFSPASLLEVLCRRLGDEAKARQALAVGKGCLLGSLDPAGARDFTEDLLKAGVSAAAVCEQHAALDSEPCEVTSCVVAKDFVDLMGPRVRVHAAFADIGLVTCSAMKISATSRSYRTVLEIVPSAQLCRLQLWDQTLAFRKCFVGDKQLGRETAFEEILRALCEGVPRGALSAAASRAAHDYAHLPRFDSYREYENYVRFCILSRLGTRLD
jgi:membrane associated rhomboid family serine protease